MTTLKPEHRSRYSWILYFFTSKRIEIALWIAASATCFLIYYFARVAWEREVDRVVEKYNDAKEHVDSELTLSILPPDIVARLPKSPSLAPVIGGIAFLLIPILCRLIFNALPFEILRSRVGVVRLPDSADAVWKTSDDRSEQPAENRDFLHTDITLLYLQSLAKASQQIAEKLYLRAGVYLLIGVLVAFSGLAFFYYQQAQQTPLSLIAVASGLKITAEQQLTTPATTPTATPATTPTTRESTGSLDNLLRTLPRFGILFFIETIAFFFLRQYRTAMDEYRYFEAIKRRREENFVLLCLLASENPLDLTKFPQQASFYSDVGALAQGQTTELLESRKLSKDETALLEKIVDAIPKIKG